ncbi:hypothetical protein [Brockia lithotrophica]|uniref:Uncharacterized protein n=1 Tax=Brockia lithotrophica TaxID=933949 RepID=A0A660KW70_9BACL|nr:hypothetical protein [Brockia lithotrophica]RKQ83799.1 hypothetical protein C7438_1458 [Brockia lithotrophica]
MEHVPFTLVHDEELDLELPVAHIPPERMPPAARDAYFAAVERASAAIRDGLRQREARFSDLYAKISGGEVDLELWEALGNLTREIERLNVLYYQLQGEHLTPPRC